MGLYSRRQQPAWPVIVLALFKQDKITNSISDQRLSAWCLVHWVHQSLGPGSIWIYVCLYVLCVFSLSPVSADYNVSECHMCSVWTGYRLKDI